MQGSAVSHAGKNRRVDNRPDCCNRPLCCGQKARLHRPECRKRPPCREGIGWQGSAEAGVQLTARMLQTFFRRVKNLFDPEIGRASCRERVLIAAAALSGEETAGPRGKVGTASGRE